VKQKEQYEKAAEKLEDQLLKLKEQREALKLQGQKHEDTIMKENAKLQKEVKYRITYMKDYMVKIEAGLADDAKLQAELKEKKRLEEERMWREQEESRRAEEESREKKAKKKKKAKSRDNSSSPSEDDSDRKRRKKAKKRSSASESSDDEGKGRRKKDYGMEEDVFQMVADMKRGKKKSGGDDMMVDMMARMSEGYTKLKKTNEELSDKCASLEDKNKSLMNRIEELEQQLRGVANPAPPPPRAATPEKRERKSRFNKIEDRDEEEKMERERSERRRREEAEEERSERGRRREDPPEEESRSSRRRFEEPPPQEPPSREKRRWDDDRARSPRGDERREERARSPREERREDRRDERRSSPGRTSRFSAQAPPARESRPPPGVPIAANPNAEPLAPRRGGGGSGLAGVLALAGGYVAPPPNMVQPPPAMVPPPPNAVESAREEINRKLEERLEEKRRSRTSGRGGGEERSRSRSRERSRRGRSSERREKDDQFNIGDWVKKPSTQREEGMANLREKLKEARDEETRKEENEMKSRWGAKEPIAPPPVPPPSGPPPGALAENRSSVAMSWGTGQKPGNRASAGRESAERGTKVAPIVGKMPWAKGTVGRKSKFGPPVEGGVPPPSIVTSQPTLQATPGQGQDPPHQDWGPPPGIRSDWGNMNSYQPPAMPSWGSHNYGYGSEVGEQDGVNAGPPQPPVPAPEPKKAGRNQAINPKPSAPIDMASMLAAAQQHMQKSLANKLESIGVPLPEHLRKEAGLTRGVESYEVPDAIPLPEQGGVDLDIAAPSVDMSITAPQIDIPMPPGAGGEYDEIAEPEPTNQEYNQQQAQEAQYQDYSQQDYYQQGYTQQDYYNYHQAAQESSAPAPPGEVAPPGEPGPPGDPAPPGDDDDCRPPGDD